MIGFGIYFCLLFIGYCQFSKVDSLTYSLNGTTHDTTRINTLLSLSAHYSSWNPDSAFLFAREANILARKIKDPVLFGKSVRMLGWNYYLKGNYQRAIVHLHATMTLCNTIENSPRLIKYKSSARLLLSSTMGSLGVIYRSRSDYKRALEYYFKALQIIHGAGEGNTIDKAGAAIILGNIGNIYLGNSDFPKAMEYYSRALKIDEELGNKNGMARHIGNIGLIYFDQADYPHALEYFLRALKMGEETGDKAGQSAALCNIGLVYGDQADFPRALEYYFRALKMMEEIGDITGQTSVLGNMGTLYGNMGDYSRTLEYYKKTLKMMEELGDLMGQAAVLGNIGIVYTALAGQEQHPDSAASRIHMYEEALEYYFRSLNMREKIGGDQVGHAANLLNIGNLLIKTGRFAEAEKYIHQALELSHTIGVPDNIRNSEMALSQLYDTLADHPLTPSNKGGEYRRLAFEHYRKYINMRDSISNNENVKKQTQIEMNYEFDKKQATAKAEQDKKDALAAAERKRQRLFLWLVVAVALAVAVIAGIILRSLIVTRRQKRTIEKAKKIIEEQKTVVEKQKETIEEKNRNITDSIEYAKRIQEAILPPMDEFQKICGESFIFHKQRDIIGGDFYFVAEVNEWKIVALADCTGHGVPGALMSMLGKDMLSEIINDRKVTLAGQVLDMLNSRVIDALNPDKTTELKVKDGMDIAFIAIKNEFTGQTGNIQFSSANRPLIICSNGSCTRYDGDQRSIGGERQTITNFSTQTIRFEKKSMIYLFTDGYGDQFGGPKQKKFKTKNLIHLLQEISQKPVIKQNEILEKRFNEWMGEYEQTDDVTIIGIRL